MGMQRSGRYWKIVGIPAKPVEQGTVFLAADRHSDEGWQRVTLQENFAPGADGRTAIARMSNMRGKGISSMSPPH